MCYSISSRSSRRLSHAQVTKALHCNIFCLQPCIGVSHMKGPNFMSGWFLQKLPLRLLMLNSLQNRPAKGHPVTGMDFNSSCKIYQVICLVSIDSFDLHLRWVYSNEKSNSSCINNYKNDERIKTLKEQLKTLLKLLCPHPGFVMNAFHSYNFFLDHCVSF